MKKSELLMQDLGEKGFLNGLLPQLYQHPDFLNGFGDDASIIKVDEETALAMKIDRAAEPYAVKHKLCDYDSWGHLCVITNLSDILAIGAKGLSFMLSISMPPSLEVEKAEKIVLGCERACHKYGLVFAGGDTKENGDISVTGSIVGILKGNNFHSRRKLQEGNILAVAGEIGRFASVYLCHQNGIAITDKDIEYISYPEPKFIEASVINSIHSSAISAMDNSDGLADILNTLHIQNHIGIDIYLEKLPMYKKVCQFSDNFKIPYENFAFFIGDWNIVYSIPKDLFEEIANKVADAGGLITEIGYVTGRNEELRIFKDGKVHFLKKGMYNEHFRESFEKKTSLASKVLSSSSVLEKTMS